MGLVHVPRSGELVGTVPEKRKRNSIWLVIVQVVPAQTCHLL